MIPTLVQRELSQVEQLKIDNDFSTSHVNCVASGVVGEFGKPEILLNGITKRYSDEADAINHCTFSVSHAFGEDVVVGENNCLFVFDGHGGYQTAQMASEHSYALFSNPLFKYHVTKLLKSGLTKKVEDIVRAKIGKIVEMTQHMLSGSTATWMQCFWSGSRRWVVTANMGDSEGLIVSLTKKKVYMTTAEHNWDNLASYKCYVKHCSKYGVKPLASVRATNKRNVYMLTSAKDNEVVRHLDVIANMSARFGGTQSVRRMVNIDRQGNITNTLKDHETENWGAYGMNVQTGQMVAQTLLCLGDVRDKNISQVNPYDMTVHVRELEPYEDVVLQVHSDGIGNNIWLHELIDLYENTTSSHECVDKFMEKIQTTPRDDMSFVLAKWNGFCNQTNIQVRF